MTRPAPQPEPRRAPGARWVLHVDLDEFIAAVEMLRRPELAGLPVVVGGRGDPTERGVVSTASYAAREYGVRSGMPLRTAARRCPETVFLPVDKPAYDEASRQVMAALRGLVWGGAPVLVEVLGWDEAFVGPAPEVEQADLDPVSFARELRAAVLAETELHCSVGIGDNKLRAKIATDFGKPRGVSVLTGETWFEVMGERPTTALWGVGTKTARKLEALGITTVSELAAADARVLASELGPTMGPWYRRLGRGVGDDTVDPTPWVPRAHGREETFQTDLESRAAVEDAVRRLAAAAVADIDREGRPAARVGIKVRLRPFVTLSRSLTLAEPSNDPAVLADAAVSLLDRVTELRPEEGDAVRPVRLLGVRLEMTPP
jgi:DNA polymerase IV